MGRDCAWYDVGCKAEELVDNVSNEWERGVDTVSNTLGLGESNDLRNFAKNPLNILYPGAGLTVDVIENVGNMLPKPPDYSGPEAAAQKALDDEKRRRAIEANRRDTQASQLARLFLSDSGAQDETFNFMGL